MSWKSSDKSVSKATSPVKLAAHGGTPTSERLIPIAQVSVDDDAIDEIASILRSGQLRQGKVCSALEEQFAEKVGARYAVAVSSGTAALHLAYFALLEPGDEVLVPSFTFIATASMVNMVGAVPVFCDVNPKTFNIDVEHAQEQITPRTKAIAPVHLFGNPCDVAAIVELADQHGLKIIWDAAQAHGATFNDRDIGSFGDVVCYSFYPSKNMTTGEGGIVTTNDQELYEELKLLRSHGQSGKYYHTMLGFNYRLTDVMASLGINQLGKLDGWIESRRNNAHYLTEHLAEIPGIQTPVQQAGGMSSFNLYSILLDLQKFDCDRDTFVELLASENIGAAVHYPRPLHQQPAFENIAKGVNLPVSQDLSERILSLPVHPGLNDVDLDLIVSAIHKVTDSVMIS